MTRLPPGTRITAVNLAGVAKGRAKYRAVPTIHNGIRYASKAEAKRAQELDIMVLAKSILWWIGQPTFRLGCGLNKYVADFLVCKGEGPFLEIWAEDVKGHETAKFRHDKRLWEEYGPIDLHVIGATNTVVIPGIHGG